jgi:primosomal replication protein N
MMIDTILQAGRRAAAKPLMTGSSYGIVFKSIAARHSGSIYFGGIRYYRTLYEGPIDETPQAPLVNSNMPQRVSQKIVSASDAVELIRDGDTVAVSGFVAQGAPEAVLKALGERFEETSTPKNMTILFGGGPGDWA